jgi:hypothetical protein
LAGALIFDEKNPPKCYTLRDAGVSSNILLTRRNPKTNCWLSRIFGDRFGGKDSGLWPCNLWSQQIEGLDAFFYELAQNFEVFSKIQDQN